VLLIAGAAEARELVSMGAALGQKKKVWKREGVRKVDCKRPTAPVWGRKVGRESSSRGQGFVQGNWEGGNQKSFSIPSIRA